MKVSQRVEEIFSHAVALDQSGKLKNTIYALSSKIFIINYDSTVLLRFRLRRTETPFAHPVSFRANDYDSNQFHEEDGKIVFTLEGNGFVRKKSCGTPEATPEDINELFGKYQDEGESSVQLSKDILTFLDPALSHVEISGLDGKLLIVQRNIYSGAVIEITRAEKKGLGAVVADQIQEDFGPIGIRTGDFSALFSFCDVLEFNFGLPGYARVKSLDSKMDMSGLLALCKYDELGTIETLEGDNGRKEQKDRRGQSVPDPKVGKGESSRRRKRE